MPVPRIGRSHGATPREEPPREHPPGLDRPGPPGGRHRTGPGHGRCEKVGNGHPGTAMSLAPAAYLLFQKVMRHDPADPDWHGRDRFVLSVRPLEPHALHPALPRRVRPRLEDLKALRTWGSRTPGHPEHGHTAGVETTTGPLGQGVANAVGMAMAPRRERGLLDPDAAGRREPVRPPRLRHLQRRRPRGGRQRRGVVPRRPPAARQPRRDLRRQQDLDRGRHRDRVQRGRLGALRGLRLARPGRRLDPRRHRVRRGRARAVGGDPGRQGGHRPAELHQPPHDHRLAGAQRAEHRQGARLRARRRTRSPPPRRSSGSTPSRSFQVDDEVLEHTRGLVARGRAAHEEWQTGFDAWTEREPGAQGTARPDDAPARCPTAGATACRRSRPTPRAWPPARRPARCSPRSPRRCPSCGAGRPTWRSSNNTTPKGEPSFVPAEHATKEFPGDEYGRVLHFGIREHAMGVGDERHRAARRHPGLRRHVPGLLRLHAPRRPARLDHAAAR